MGKLIERLPSHIAISAVAYPKRNDNEIAIIVKYTKNVNSTISIRVFRFKDQDTLIPIEVLADSISNHLLSTVG
jgi:hypothetical protein